jgi:hypothetical protein
MSWNGHYWVPPVSFPQGATQQQRGDAAQWREQFQMSQRDRNILNKVVHEKHAEPTRQPMFKAPKPEWTVKPRWKGSK